MMEKKKFKFPIRKELFTSVLSMVIIFGIMFAFMPLLGINNAMITSMGILPILMVTRNDYSLHIKKNTIFFFIIQMALVALAFVASFNIATKIPISFAVFFLIIYIFTYDDKMSVYMPFLLNFIMMLYFPVYGTDLGIRFAIVAIETLLMMSLQLLVHRNKFKKKIKKQMTELVPIMEKQIKAIENKEDQKVILELNQTIATMLTKLQGALDAKMGHFLKKWEDGNRYLKGVLLFKRINRFLEDTYCSTEDKQESYAPDILDSLTILLDTIIKYEEKQVDQQTVELAIYNFSHQMGSTTLSFELETDIQLFEKEHINDPEQIKATTSFWETLKSRMNINNLIYALKVSFVCAIGMLISELFHIPSPYLFPLSLIVVTQPYTKFTRKAAGSRMLNTVYMVIIYLLAFSFTNIIWLNILILLLLIIVGDIFLKFNFNVIISGLLSVALGSLASTANGVTGTQYAFIRLAYVFAACILFLLIDAFFFPHHVNANVKKQLNQSVALNQQMLYLLSHANTTTNELLNILKQKRAINRKLKFNQQYLKLDEINQYLLSEQEWTERIYFIYDSISENKLTMAQISHAYQMISQGAQTVAEYTKAETDLMNKSVVLNMYYVIKGMQTSENIALEKIRPAFA